MERQVGGVAMDASTCHGHLQASAASLLNCGVAWSASMHEVVSSFCCERQGFVYSATVLAPMPCCAGASYAGW